MQAVVLDTNVLIAATFRPESDSGRLVQAVREGRYRLVWDEPTRRETRTLFERIPPIDWSSVSDLFVEDTLYAGTTDPAAFTSVPDPDDRKFAALAAAAGAVLVSLDAHLLEARVGDRVDVVRPSELLARER